MCINVCVLLITSWAGLYYIFLLVPIATQPLVFFDAVLLSVRTQSTLHLCVSLKSVFKRCGF